MLITKVQKSRRERGRYDVYIDDKPVLCVSDAFRTKHGLFAGAPIEESALPALLDADLLDRACQTALNFVSYRPRSSKEVIDRLGQKGFQRGVAAQAVERLKDLQLLNDIEFARMFVRDKLRGKPMGISLLRKKLIEKGISFQLSDRILKEYIKPEDEEKAAKALLQRKLRNNPARLAKLELRVRRKRLTEYLMRRGFSLEVASKTVRTTNT